MFQSITTYFFDLLPLLKGNAGYLYGFLFLVSVLESTPIIGTFVPGTIILTMFGFLASQQYANLGIQLCVAISGGILGDIIGYNLGKHGKKYFKDHKGVFVYSHLETAKDFFHTHKGKSLLIGRFMGPIRAIVPFFAGLYDLPFKTFFWWNALGTVLWTSMYLILGFLFGRHWRILETWTARVAVVVCVVAIIAIIYYIQRQKVSPKDKKIIDIP